MADNSGGDYLRGHQDGSHDGYRAGYDAAHEEIAALLEELAGRCLEGLQPVPADWQHYGDALMWAAFAIRSRGDVPTEIEAFRDLFEDGQEAV